MICEVMRIGQALSPVVYEAKLEGMQLVALFEKCNIDENIRVAFYRIIRTLDL